MNLRGVCLVFLLLQVIYKAASSTSVLPPSAQQKSKSSEICLSDTSVEGGVSSCKEKVCMPPGDWWKESYSDEIPNKGYRVEHCPKGWITFKPNKCLKSFLGTKKSQKDAEKDCSSQGAHLASIANKEEHNFLVSFVIQNSNGKEPEDVWLGGTQKESKFYWSDYSPFDYTSWAKGHPGEPGDKCVYLVTGKEMDKTAGSDPTMGVKSCSESLGYLCQKCQSEERHVFFIRSDKDKSGIKNMGWDHDLQSQPSTSESETETENSTTVAKEGHGQVPEAVSKMGKEVVTKHTMTKKTEEVSSSNPDEKDPNAMGGQGHEEMSNTTTTTTSESSDSSGSDTPAEEAKNALMMEHTETGKGKGKGKRRRVTTTRKTTTEEGGSDSDSGSDTSFVSGFREKFHGHGRGKGKGKRRHSVTKIFHGGEETDRNEHPDTSVPSGNEKVSEGHENSSTGSEDSSKTTTRRRKTTRRKIKVVPKSETTTESPAAAPKEGSGSEVTEESGKTTTTTKIIKEEESAPESGSEVKGESGKTTTTTTKVVKENEESGSGSGSEVKGESGKTTTTRKVIHENGESAPASESEVKGESGKTTTTTTTKVIKENDESGSRSGSKVKGESGKTTTTRIVKEGESGSEVKGGSESTTTTTKVTKVKKGSRSGSGSEKTSTKVTKKKDEDKEKPKGFVPVYAMGDPGEGISTFDLKSKDDHSFAFDFDHTGKLDHIVLYRPGSGIIQILKNTDGNFSKVYPGPNDPVNKGIGIWDLFLNKADVAFGFDYESNGKPDHLVVFRPGFGDFAIAKNDGGKFTLVYPAQRAGQGIGGWDFKYPMDRAFAFDYDHSGKMDHIVAYRAGTGGIFIIKNHHNGTFSPVYGKAAPFNSVGIGGFNLKRPQDIALAYDYDSSGKMDHMVLYRPGSGSVYIVKNTNGVFSAVYSTPDGGAGIGGFDLKKSSDRIMAYDYDGSGRQDHLLIYRPGTGSVYILKNSNGNFTPVYSQPDPGAGIGSFDLKRTNDQAYAFDYEHSGKPEYIVIYRAGRGAIYILRNDNHEHDQSGSGTGSGGSGGSSSSSSSSTRRRTKIRKSSRGGKGKGHGKSGDGESSKVKETITSVTYEEQVEEGGKLTKLD